MSIYDMVYRTKTYLAGDWEGDKNLIEQLHKWNKNQNLSLQFTDVHEFTRSSDNSNNCSIKRSLRERMLISKTFVLIVGDKTKSLRSGACFECPYYCKTYWNTYCIRSSSYVIDNRSFVEYECEMARKDYDAGKLKIVVIYNGLLNVNKTKCPEVLRFVGYHIPSDIIENGIRYWNYSAIRDAICN